MKFLAFLAAALVTGIATAPVAAQDYPNRTITMLVPFSPGSAADQPRSSHLDGRTESIRYNRN